MSRAKPSAPRGRVSPPSRLHAALVDFLGEARVWPSETLDGVVEARPASNAEVQGVLAVARQHGTPVLPVSTGADLSQLQAPSEGGVLLSLEAMNRVLEVNHSERYAVVEPGVTWRQLHRRLGEEGGDLALPTPAAPRGLSIWGSALMEGVGGPALSHGAIAEKVWGVEALLITGEAVRTGAGAADGGWWGRGPIPDLTGLFVGWGGATGVVTRLAVSLRPRHRYERRLLIPASTRRGAVAASIRLARSGMFDDTTVLPWQLFRCLFGVGGEMRRHPSEPEAFVHVDWSASTRPELEYKRLRLGQALARASERGGRFDDPIAVEDLAGLGGGLSGLEDLPLRLPLPPHAAPATALACHGPISRLVDALAQVEAAAVAHGLYALVTVRPMRGGHYGVLHAALPYPSGEAGQAAAHAAAARAIEALLDLGFLPSRYPPELGNLVFAKLHPGTQRLSHQLRRLVDPERLLDPGRWGLPTLAR